jgi:hypothetical protein
VFHGVGVGQCDDIGRCVVLLILALCVYLAIAIIGRMKTDTTPTTPLLTLLRDLGTRERRDEFAAKCDTSTLYLYQVAGCHRRSCSAHKAYLIEQTSKEFNLLYGTPVVTMAEIATMCNAEGGCAP